MQRTKASWWCAAVAVAVVSCSSSDGGPGTVPAQDGGAGSGGQAGSGGGDAGAAGAVEQFVVPRLVECLNACATEHPDGRAALGTLTSSCACDVCAKACGGLCGGGALDDGCAHGCLIPLIHMGSCDNQKYDCNHDAACGPYLSCALLCIAPAGMVKVTYDQMRQACVDRINDYREIEGVAPLARKPDAEKCADGSAAKDESLNKPHASFGACQEKGQNECFKLGAVNGSSVFLKCLEEMYMEKYTGVENGGHYENMVRTSFSSVSCGFAIEAATQNFY